MIQVHACTTFKQIELESRSWSLTNSQVWSGFEFATKPDQPGLSRLIRLEVIKDRRKILVRFLY